MIIKEFIYKNVDYQAHIESDKDNTTYQIFADLGNSAIRHELIGEWTVPIERKIFTIKQIKKTMKRHDIEAVILW